MKKFLIVYHEWWMEHKSFQHEIIERESQSLAEQYANAKAYKKSTQFNHCTSYVIELSSDIIERESDIFNGSANGMTAKTNDIFKPEYTVTGTYMDSNGCMKTYGKSSDGRYCDSFIQDSIYE